MPFVEYRRIPTQWEFFLCNSKRQPTHHHHSSTNPSSQPIIQPIIQLIIELIIIIQPIIQPIINPSSKTYLFLVSCVFLREKHLFFFPSKKPTPKLLRNAGLGASCRTTSWRFPFWVVFDATYNTTYFKREPQETPLFERKTCL